MASRVLGREPVMTVSTVVALLIAVLPVFGWSAETVGLVCGALVVIGGAVSAGLVSVDRLLPLLVGVAKAVLAVVAAFGLHVPDNYVAALMAVLTVVAGFATRTQVGAVEPPRDRNGFDISQLPRPLQLPRNAPSGQFMADWDAAERAANPTPPPPGAGEAHTEVLTPTATLLPDHGQGERGGEGRHAQRGWIAGWLQPDGGL